MASKNQSRMQIRKKRKTRASILTIALLSALSIGVSKYSNEAAKTQKASALATATDVAEIPNNNIEQNSIEENSIEENSIEENVEAENSPEVVESTQESTVEYEFPESYEKPINYDKNTDLLDLGITDLLFDVDTIREEYSNDDITSWVVIPNTEVSEPIAQKTTKEDSDYYLHHSLDGSETKAGTIFQDWRDSSFTKGFDELSDISYTYGHHMRNGSMYAPVDDYQKQSFYDNHPYGILYTPQDTYKLEIFASNVYDAKDYDNVYSYDFTDEDTFNAFIDYINEYSLIETNVNVEYGDRIFVFVTCNYDGTPINVVDGKEKRLYVYAKMVPQYTNYIDKENNKALTLKQ